MGNKEQLKKTLGDLLISVAAIIFSFIISALIMLVAGYNPIQAYSAMLDGAFGSMTSIANTLSKATPLIFVGLACAFANKGGIFNIGAEGQLYMGAFAATLVALSLQGMPRLVIIIASILAGALAGGLVGGLNGLLKAKLKINEVIVAIMLNYVCKFLTSHFVNGPLKEEGSQTAKTVHIGTENMLTTLVPKTQLTTALIIALILVVALYFFFAKTRAGYNIRAVGENPLAAQASGIAMSGTIILTMGTSGALAGLAGATEVFGKLGRFIDLFSPGYGFTGIAVAVLGRNNPFAVLLSALLFGVIDAGSMKMSYVAGVSTSMISVMQGLVILFVATPNLVRYIKIKKGSK
ncbi:MAG: ABC transporter permease [Oscillospiraceae bacterium]|nr:ABC transporter permease [Oscillospiraceae bacterium]MBQ9148237.1 ABC transporter permease [Oscillospiraceae bacterium]